MQAFENYIRQEESGVYAVTFMTPRNSARTVYRSVLKGLLDPKVPFAWVQTHYASPAAGWWNTEIPLEKGGQPRFVQVRNLQYDIQMGLQDFFRYLDELLQDSGILMYHTTKPVHDTLRLDDINEEPRRIPILIQNGVVASVYMPTLFDMAHFWSVDREAISRALLDEEVRKHAVRRKQGTG